ncbi:LPD38 domain-containing protein [Yersinia sp. Marseille-Q5920]|uniref:LPD38 domain-containing protein n=1 Tax=Yersinia sp. Marseille-Q5920 TaxID=2972785 RepID=UPI0022650108|nr:LPD38 domain-containing protein [Yersinia sp. Marseille-Q5920]
MTYDPQQQRPEEQTTNSNRETLNIQQPGENANTGFDWGVVRAAREAAGRQSKVPQANDPSVGLKDVLLSAAAAPTDIISGNAQLFKAGNQRLDDKASEYRSGEKKPLIDIPVSPEMLRVMQENSGNLLSRAGNAVIGGVGDLAQSASKEIKSNYSEGAKEAAAMDFITFERDKNKNVTGIKAGAGLFDKDAWMINAIPSISQMFLTASGAKLGANAVERMAEKGAYNRLIKVLPEEAARATAKETAQMAKRRAQVTGFVGVSTGTAQGQGGNDPELYRAFTMIDLERSNSTFMKAARQAKKVLTVSTTSMPDFIIRNFMRDSIHSWAINKDGFKPVTASWAGFKKALRTDDSLVDMMFAGATFGGGYSNVYDPASTAKTIRSVLRRKGYNDSQIHEFESSIARNSKEVMGKIEQGLHKYKNLSEAAENANRLATYEAAIKSGKSKAQAAFESRDLMDFSMMGASNIMINLSDMLPFFNARMQGLSKLGRGIKENPREVLKRGGMITAASLALMALNWDDKRYEELQDWDKDTYWHAWIGDQHVRFPKPFEIGLMFGTLTGLGAVFAVPWLSAIEVRADGNH